ncbi:MAG: reverse transcriptase family protein [Bacteroidota bacterium]
MSTSSARTLKRRQQQFCSLNQPRDLGYLLEIPTHKLTLLSLNPQYRLFSIPKKDGSQRWLEDPTPDLKEVQTRLNRYLQAIAYKAASPAAYGFILTASRDPHPRNIVTNAEQHLGCRWLYNADIEDFFHRISWQTVFEQFSAPPFDFDDELAQLLTRLCTHKERLPMGAPTSPVLSNFACREMDAQLLDLAAWAGWTYTRFADDMSFSAHDAMSPEHLDKIIQIVESFDFTFNPEKVHLYGPEDAKTVTGLRLEEQVKLPAGYAAMMNAEITKLGHVLEVQQQAGRQSGWVARYRQRVEGLITFAAFVLGDDHPVVDKADARLLKALNPPEPHATLSWLDFPYV